MSFKKTTYFGKILLEKTIVQNIFGKSFSVDDVLLLHIYYIDMKMKIREKKFQGDPL